MLETTLAAEPAAVREARALVEEAARPYVSRESLNVLRLLLSEVVTHAVRGGGRRTLTVAVTAGDSIYVEVERPGGRFLAGGRDASVRLGLEVIGHLAERWGAEGGSGGRMWFSVPRWPDG